MRGGGLVVVVVTAGAEGHDGRPVGPRRPAGGPTVPGGFVFFNYFLELFAKSQTVPMAHICRELKL
jgi:hypothetical protein